MLSFAAIAIAIGVLIVNPSLVGVAAVALIYVLLWYGQRETEAINPYYLFLSTPVSLLVYSDSVSAIFLPALSDHVQMIIAGGIFSYFAGLQTVRRSIFHTQSSTASEYSFWAITAIGITPNLLGILTAGIPLLAYDVNFARANYNIPVVGQFMIFLPVSILIAFRSRSLPLVIVSTTLNLFFSIIVAAKFNIMFTALFFIFAYFQYEGKALFKIRPIYLLLTAFGVMPVIFSSIFSVRETAVQAEYAWRQGVNFSSSFLDYYGDYTYLPYLYLTTSWSNFSYIVDLQLPPSYGVMSIYSLLSVFQLDGLFEFIDRPVREVQFNTHGYLADFYLDFGIAGTLLLSFCLGCMVKLCYVVAIERADVLSQGIWLCVGFASSMLFFSNHFTGLSYPLLSIILFNSYRIISRTIKTGTS